MKSKEKKVIGGQVIKQSTRALAPVDGVIISRDVKNAVTDASEALLFHEDNALKKVSTSLRKEVLVQL